MGYAAREARQELLDALAEAIEELGVALAALGEAYEQLDERSADRLEAELFRPAQLAYGRAKATHAGFAERHGLPGRRFEAASAGLVSQGVKGFIDKAVESFDEAVGILIELQDSMRPVEVGDTALRAGLAEVREMLGPLPARTQEVLRTFGR